MYSTIIISKENFFKERLSSFTTVFDMIISLLSPSLLLLLLLSLQAKIETKW